MSTSDTTTAAVDAQRHDGIHRAVDLLVDGTPGRALFALSRSVQRQARIADLGDVAQVPCPCGGRCGR